MEIYAVQALEKTEPIWSEIYTDDSGFGNVTTIAVPVFVYYELLFGMIQWQYRKIKRDGVINLEGYIQIENL